MQDFFAENFLSLFLIISGLLLIIIGNAHKTNIISHFFSFEIISNKANRYFVTFLGIAMIAVGLSIYFFDGAVLENSKETLIEPAPKQPEVPQSPPPRETQPQPNPPSEPEFSQTSELEIISWAGPYNQEGYEAQNFTQNGNGFTLGILKDAVSPTLTYGIQVESYSPVNLETGKRYKLRFSAQASNDFNMIVRLGERSQPWKSSINDEAFFIQGGAGFDISEKEFTVLDIANDSYLYFQLGNAPNGAQVDVKEVAFFPSSK